MPLNVKFIKYQYMPCLKLLNLKWWLFEEECYVNDMTDST